jgi:Tol biopolymer transport system component
LVTPPATITGPKFQINPAAGGFNTPTSDESGSRVLFSLKGEALAGSGGTGTTDTYMSERSSSGWTSRLFGPTGEQAGSVEPGGTSAGYSSGFSWILRPGTLANGRYLVKPDGSVTAFRVGSLADDPNAIGRWISPVGDHVIFTSEKRLEPEAPEEVGCCPFGFWQVGLNEPVDAVYEWTPSGLQVLSLLPNDEPVPAGSTTYYWGTSKDGSSVVFNVGGFFGENGTLYVRHNGTTFPIVTVPFAEEAVYMGSSSSGDKIFYLVDPGVFFGETSGKLFEYDVDTEETRQITDASDVSVVNVSEDGSHVYFISGEQLDGSQGTLGGRNLYVWRGGETNFVAELSPEDVGADFGRKSLIAWPLVISVAQQSTLVGQGVDPSRSTPDGSVFVFEAKSNLTAYDSAGHNEIYRYSTQSGQLSCVSCNPAGAPPTSDARLQGVSSLPEEEEKEAPTVAASEVRNVRNDGKAVFFISGDRLVDRDTDGKLDVYEWREGQIALISYGRSEGGNEWLYGVSPDGSDVFFTSADRLVPEKQSNTFSLYDARINGGFPPESTPVPCAIGSCQGGPSIAPAAPAVGTARALRAGNLKPRRRHLQPCKKLRGKRRKRCLQAHKHKKNSAENNRRAG